MGTFAFRAVDLAGVPARGEVEAGSKAQVTEQLRQRGLIVLDVSEKREALKLESVFQRFKSVNLRNLSVFSRQFATLIASGMPMLRSLYTLEEQTEDEMLKAAIVGVRQDVEAGSSVAAAMESQPGVFDPLYRSMVCAGEGVGPARGGARPGRVPAREARRAAPPGQVGADVPGGRLRARAGGDDRRRRLHRPGLRRHLRGDRRREPRAPTRAAADDPDHGRRLRLDHRQVVHPPAGDRARRLRLPALEEDRARARCSGTRIKLRLPFHIGDIVQKVALARWSRTFSGTVSSGVPILQAIQISGETAGNAVIRRRWTTSTTRSSAAARSRGR